MGLKFGECDGEVGLPEGDDVRLGLGIMRGDNNVIKGATDRDRMRSLKPGGQDSCFRSHDNL